MPCPAQPPQPDEIVQQFEKAIKELVRCFQEHPYAFYTESDMHCYLYHELYAGGFFNGLFKTAEGHDTILLHKEYPTAARYSRRADGTLVNDPAGRRRGAFDISIWDPAYINDQPHRKQKVLCAAELALNECGIKSIHTVNDATKLADKDNEVKYGYLLFFVRDEPDYQRNQTKIRQELDSAAERARVVIVCVNGADKPEPTYLGPWGKI